MKQKSIIALVLGAILVLTVSSIDPVFADYDKDDDRYDDDKDDDRYDDDKDDDRYDDDKDDDRYDDDKDDDRYDDDKSEREERRT